MNIEELKKNIPHGYNRIIATKAGVCPGAVTNWVKGRTNSVKIELAALEVISELNKKRKALSDGIEI